MKYPIVFCALVSLASACGSKEADKPAATGGDKPASTTVTPAAPATAGKAATAADLPAECRAFTNAMEKLMACDTLKESRDSMKAGYDQMLKAMIDLGDKKAMIDGCQAGVGSLEEALKTAGC